MDPTPLAVVNIADAEVSVPSVRPDEHGIGITATSALLAAGHRSIAHLTISDRGPAVDLRASGYIEAMQRAGCTPHVVPVDGRADAIAGRRATGAAIEQAPATSAVFAFNDPMAMGAYQWATSHGMGVPEDLSVIGVDNLEVIAAQLQPPLTTVELPHAEMGAWAVRAVTGPQPERGPAAVHALLEAPIIARASISAKV